MNPGDATGMQGIEWRCTDRANIAVLDETESLQKYDNPMVTYALGTIFSNIQLTYVNKLLSLPFLGHVHLSEEEPG